MPRQIDYYFSMFSPWAYMGHAPFMDIVRRHNVAVTYKPVALVDVFSETGGLPLPKRHPVRQRYRMFELQRWREKRGLKFNLRPKFGRFDVSVADRFVIAMVAAGHDPDAYLRRAFAAIWEEEENLAEDAMLVAIADRVGLPGAQILGAARSEASQASYQRHVHEAIASDVVGSPGYVLDGEVFWGQDRLELLDDALSSGRKAFRSDL